MIVKMIKTGKRAAKKCKKSFAQKAKIMQGKRREIVRKGEMIEKKAEIIYNLTMTELLNEEESLED